MFTELFQSLGGKMPTLAGKAAEEARGRTQTNATAASLGLQPMTATRIEEPFRLRDLPHHFLQFMNDKQAEFNDAKKLNTLRQSRILDMLTPPVAQQPLAAPIAPPQQMPQQFELPPAKQISPQGSTRFFTPNAVPLNRIGPQ